MDNEPINTEATPATPESAPVPETPVESAPEVIEPQAETKRSALFFAGIAAVLLAVGAAGAWHYGLFDSLFNKETAEVATGALTEEEASAPIARVNGTTITRGALEENLEQMKQAALAQGADPNDLVVKTQIEEQAYEITINNELLKQAAEKDTPKPTDEEINAEIERLKEQNGGAEAFAALLAEVGFTQEELRENVTRSMHIKAYLSTKQTPVTVSDEEVKAFYDSLGGEGAGLPPLDEVHEQVVAELENQKTNEQVTKILEELRAAATIEKV